VRIGGELAVGKRGGATGWKVALPSFPLALPA
jgi:hypothetical protein